MRAIGARNKTKSLTNLVAKMEKCGGWEGFKMDNLGKGRRKTLRYKLTLFLAKCATNNVHASAKGIK